MSLTRRVITNDVRTATRDRTLAAMLVVPVIFLLLLRLGLPALGRVVEVTPEVARFTHAALCSVAALFPAFLLSMIMLDEKDAQIPEVYRVLPVPGWRLLAIRILPVLVLGFGYALVLIAAGGQVHRGFGAVLLLSCACAAPGPFAVLAALAFSSNKIEGLALFKMIFFVTALAGGGLFVTTGWGLALRAIPAYWTYSAFAGDGPLPLMPSVLIAIAGHLLLGALCYLRLRKPT